MPNAGHIKSVERTRFRLVITATDGTTLTVTRAEIRAHYLSEDPPGRKLKTIIWLKNLIRDTFGEAILPFNRINFDLDEDDGSPTMFEIISSEGL